MLDAILCSSNGSGDVSCFENINALNVGVAISNDILYNKVSYTDSKGNINDAFKDINGNYLIYDKNNIIAESISIDVKWATVGAKNVVGLKNLFFTNSSKANMTYNECNSFCLDSGMNIPYLDETIYTSSQYISSTDGMWTWSQTSHDTAYGFKYVYSYGVNSRAWGDAYFGNGSFKCQCVR